MPMAERDGFRDAAAVRSPERELAPGRGNLRLDRRGGAH